VARLVETAVDGSVGLARLDSPKTRNALSIQMREELGTALEEFERDPAVRCIVIAGSDKVFAAGADIKAMAERPIDSPPDPAAIAFWQRLWALETPLVAAVSGYALGGGCELAMSCDMIVADEGARLGQPEITLGIIPGGGGTQRLARAIGKQRAMEYVLTGKLFDAATGADWGLVNRVSPAGEWLEAALDLAAEVAERPPIAARLGKRAVLTAFETPLSEGLEIERELFEETMQTEDRVEGMRAFVEKRPPKFKGT
jgi:enoyl-CoA hydratase